jgi:hypothetical protein
MFSLAPWVKYVVCEKTGMEINKKNSLTRVCLNCMQGVYRFSNYAKIPD